MIIEALAVWRLAHLIVYEDGPGDIFWRIRKAAGAEDEGSLSNLAKGLTCIWCVSMWAAMFLIALRLLIPKLAVLLVLPLALSAGAILVHSVVAKLQRE